MFTSLSLQMEKLINFYGKKIVTYDNIYNIAVKYIMDEEGNRFEKNFKVLYQKNEKKNQPDEQSQEKVVVGWNLDACDRFLIGGKSVRFY